MHDHTTSPIAGLVIVLSASLSTLPAQASARTLSWAAGLDRQPYHQETTTETLGFKVEIDAVGDRYNGELIISRESYPHGRTLTYTSYFDPPLPATIPIPRTERMTHINDQVMSEISGQSESIRINEYGTFETLAILAAKAAEWEISTRFTGGKKYLSNLLLLTEPTSIHSVRVNRIESGNRVIFTMDNDAVISYLFDHNQALNGIEVNHDDIQVTYVTGGQDALISAVPGTYLPTIDLPQ